MRDIFNHNRNRTTVLVLQNESNGPLRHSAAKHLGGYLWRKKNVMWRLENKVHETWIRIKEINEYGFDGFGLKLE